MGARARFTQADVKRAIAGAVAAGQRVSGVQLNDNGFVVLFGEEEKVRRRNKADELYGPQA